MPKIDEFIKQADKNAPFSNDAITNLANSIKKRSSADKQ